MLSPEISAAFTARQRIIWLSAIKRYADIPYMIHRPELFSHVRGTAYSARNLGQIAIETTGGKYRLDLKEVFTGGYFHDDDEMVNGDIPSPVKAVMTADQLQGLDKREQEGASALAHFLYNFPPDITQKYLDFHAELKALKTPTSKLVEIADKWHALGEKLHEIRCGNSDFIDLLDHSRKQFAGFEKWDIWQEIKNHPLIDFDNFPSNNSIAKLPTISIDNLVPEKQPADIWEARTHLIEGLLPEKDDSSLKWPEIYKTWIKVGIECFDPHIEKFLLPGWYLRLWEKWNIYPSRTASSGLYITR